MARADLVRRGALTAREYVLLRGNSTSSVMVTTNEHLEPLAKLARDQK